MRNSAEPRPQAMLSAVSIFDFSAPLLDGRLISLRQFEGRVLLIVNTASRCGFTPQLQDLEDLHRRYIERGFSVLGFPCNQFGRQEPGSAAEIGAFCRANYGVTFPLFAKVEVNGPGAHPLYRWMKARQPGRFGLLTRGRIPWNFTKFLIDRRGRVAARYGPSTRPSRMTSIIEDLLQRD